MLVSYLTVLLHVEGGPEWQSTMTALRRTGPLIVDVNGLRIVKTDVTTATGEMLYTQHPITRYFPATPTKTSDIPAVS